MLDAVLFLTKNGLSFRGHQENLSVENGKCGLFLSTIQLISKHSPVLKQHLDTVADSQKSENRMQAHYLSPRTQNDFLELCGNKVSNSILDDVRSARYYGIIVDGTPDSSHKEQLVFVFRYVLQVFAKWEITESFIKLVHCDKKTGVEIAEVIKNVLEECGIDFQLCRGQGFDNAPNMSGIFNGVQAILSKENQQAYYTPCNAHSLNLCGVHVMSTSIVLKSYFGNIETLYKIFALSPRRWEILLEKAGVSLHVVSTTRWSARIAAVRPLAKNYRGVRDSLTKVQELDLPSDIQATVESILNWINTFEFILLTTIWYKILLCLDDANRMIQSSKLSMTEPAQTEFKESGSRLKKRKHFHDEAHNSGYEFTSFEERFKVEVFNPSFDLLSTQLRELHEKSSKVSRLFAPFFSG